MKKKTYVLSGIVILLIISALIIAFRSRRIANNNTPNVQVPHTIRLIDSGDLEDAIALNDIAEQYGFYKKNNVSVEMVQSETKNFTNMLVTGAADVSMGTYTGPLTAYLNNADTRVLANAFVPFTSFGISRFPKDQADKIKKVAVQSLTGDPVNTMNGALKRLGVDPSSVEMIAVPSYNVRVEMLSRGEIDFLVLSSDALVSTLDASRGFAIYEPEEIQRGGFQSLRPIVTTKLAIEQKPQALKEFVTAIYQTLQFMDNNPDSVKKYLQEQKGFSQQRADAWFLRYQKARKGVPFVPSLDYVKDIADSIKQRQEMDGNRDLTGFVDASFAEQVVGQ